MKFFSLSTAIFFIFLVFVLAFENLAAKTTYFLLLFISADAIPPFFLTFILAFLGLVAGVFYTLFFMELIKEKKGDDVNEPDSQE